MKLIMWDKLKRLMSGILQQYSVCSDDADIIADVLASADIMGFDTHGISRLKKIYIDRIKAGIVNPVTEIEIIQDRDAVIVIDGHNGMGHVIAHRAMLTAVSKAKEYGISMSVVRNSSHFGIAGYYSLLAAKDGMIGITGTNARPSMAPVFGNENTIGTNPLTFAIPTDEDFPFLLDCATSVSQRGKVELLERQGMSVPEGWVIDSNGRYETDPARILSDLLSDKASFVPLGGCTEETGGYKGFGYGTVVEIFSAALQNGNYLKMLSGFDKHKNRIPYNLGHFFIAINISHFIEPGIFRRICGNILREIRNSRRTNPEQPIYTPGEKEFYTSVKRRKDGVPVSDELYDEIISLCKPVGIDADAYFESED